GQSRLGGARVAEADVFELDPPGDRGGQAKWLCPARKAGLLLLQLNEGLEVKLVLIHAAQAAQKAGHRILDTGRGGGIEREVPERQVTLNHLDRHVQVRQG